jgi:multidrug efflux pump subunit AcrA (membrane-fusion protein)
MQLAIDSHRSRLLQLALCLALALVIALPSATWFTSRAEATAKPSEISVATTARWPVVAVGTIEPKQGLLDIAAPAWDMGPAIVTAMHVREGD